MLTVTACGGKSKAGASHDPRDRIPGEFDDTAVPSADGGGVWADVVPAEGAYLGDYHHLDYLPSDGITHLGVDIFGPDGGPGHDINAMADGTVVDVIDDTSDGDFDALGYMVILGHGEIGDEGKDMYTLHLHLEEPPDLSIGDARSQGESIGRIGNTGASNGYFHTYFEIRYFSERYSDFNNIYYLDGDIHDDPDALVYAEENWEDPEVFEVE